MDDQVDLVDYYDDDPLEQFLRQRSEHNSLTHTDREGNTMLIGEMEDGHLINMINLLSRAIERVRKSATVVPLDEYQAALYGRKAIDAKTAGELARSIIVKAEPYVMEATLRGLQIQETVQDMLGRTTRIGEDELPSNE